MPRQFVIVNNGMTEVRGHYLETALSIAEAARDVGFRPLLAVHRTCRINEMPTWLECRAHFRVDHWGGNVDFTPLRVPEIPALSFRQRIKAAAKSVLPSALRNLVRRVKPPPAPEEPDDPELHHEIVCSRLFEEDLECLAESLALGDEDIFFMPTAHPREVLAVRRVVAKSGVNRTPRFHLEFRHEIAEGGNQLTENRPDIARATRLARELFVACENVAEVCEDRLNLWTDTEELADDYRACSGMAVGVLPIPFNHALIENRPYAGRRPLRCLYLGDVREEKGFHLLPDLVRSFASDDRIEFIIQATRLHPAAVVPSVVAALRELESADPRQVRLVGRDEDFLPRAHYYELLSSADIVLCLYDARIYRARSSGIMTEALAAGKPVIVPAGTWMSNQLPVGCGEAFADAPSLLSALRRIVDDYARYHASVQAQRPLWLEKHSPQALFRCLTREIASTRRAA